MKHVLLPEAGEGLRYYKVNLHNHTTISDGKISPEEVKERYKSHGYAAVAFTDHEVFLRHNDLTDESFVALNGMELGLADQNDPVKNRRVCCHINFIAMDPDMTRPVGMHREKYQWGTAKEHFAEMDLPEDEPDYVRMFSGVGVSDLMKRGREAGFFVIYNHPTWSLETLDHYRGYEGMHAMEIVNYGCVRGGYPEENSHCYDELLRQGKRLFCVATDDGHHARQPDDPLVDEFGGYVMVAAEKLEYRALTDALAAGRFYARTGDPFFEGPEILGITLEDGVVTVKAKGARTVDIQMGRRKAMRRCAMWGETVDEAVFELPEEMGWFRITLQDERGFRAYSNAYFPDDYKD
ncbi:MAG: PHP domain-containing protein [Clostridia bacterium]|nr:PHP domain-containing protein [Clostridia bacterium]